MPIADHLVDIAQHYEQYREKKTVDKTSVAYQLVSESFPKYLQETLDPKRPYIITGSTGRGNLTPAPWIALLDPAVTKSPQEGYYVVYLFSLNLLEVELSLALGVTKFEQIYGSNRTMLTHLDNASKRLSEKLQIPDGWHIGPINLEAKTSSSLHGKYERANIVSIHYDLTDLPDEQQLRLDLSNILTRYEILRKSVGPNVDEEEALSNADVKIGQELTIIPFEPRKKSARSTAKHFHPQRRSTASKKIGDAGEHLVLDYEKKRLSEAGFLELAKRVRWLADEGEHPGYDILSYNEDGTERWIEVKASVGGKINSVELTENERKTAAESARGTYWLYIVCSVFKDPKLMYIQDPVIALSWGQTNPQPVTWRLDLL